MTDKITIPYNDVFFYGIYLKEKEQGEVKNDIFANILMRYLRTLEPVSNRLYRVQNTDKFEYSFSFVPSQPLSWRVIKNRRVIEDIEYLSDGKYCLNYYDDGGRDLKRVIFSKENRWLKTNYYNSLYGDSLLCSIVPKELNGETVILLYPTGATYPVTHYCLKQPSSGVVLKRIMERIPKPEVSALTNYGIMYFGTESTQNIYNQILKEEEERYAEETKPQVFATDEDIETGFCFTPENFEGNGGVFSLSEALEFSESELPSAEFTVLPNDDVLPAAVEEPQEEETEEFIIPKTDEDDYSLKNDLAAAIEIIETATNLQIDDSLILDETVEEIFVVDTPDEIVIEPIEDVSEDIIHELVIEPDMHMEEDFAEIDVELSVEVEESTDHMPVSEPASLSPTESATLLQEDDIDDYVKSLIDSLLVSAKSAVNEYSKGESDSFSQEDSDNAPESSPVILKNEITDGKNPPSQVIKSNSENYYFFGDYTETGRNGRGKTLMENGFTAYEGEYLDDMRHGRGSFYFKSGDLCYYGNWKENKREGFGMGVSSESGISHIGKWQDNKPCGVGARFDKFGNFLYLDSKSENVNGGIRVVGFGERSLLIEYYDAESLTVVKKEIFIDDIK